MPVATSALRKILTGVISLKNKSELNNKFLKKQKEFEKAN